MDSANAASEHKKTPTVLWEDDVLLVLDKPSGLVVHSDGRTEESSVVDWLGVRSPELKDIGGQHTLDSGRYAERFGLLHRIDRDTSGVILVAKTDEAFYFFQRQFLDRSTQKVYRAFVKGHPKENSGVIDAPIGRSRADFRQWTVGEGARGTLRKAITEYQVLASSEEYAELEVVPKTGRTHQIRVHLKSIGCPILCDPRYGAGTGLGFGRLALHAWKITVAYPDGTQKTFEAPLPADFLHAETLLAG
jgi:23S rRNA pseudouridine1911/1915/1917 synthase